MCSLMVMCSLYFVLWLLNFSFYYKGINYRVFKNCLLLHVLCGFFQVFFFFSLIPVWFSKLSLSFWRFSSLIYGCYLSGFESHSEALCTWAWFFICQLGLFIRVASKCQYFISLFLWCHCTSSKNRWGGRNRNLLGSGTSAHMCESMYAGGVSSDGLTYCSPILSFHPHHLLSLHSNLCSLGLIFLEVCTENQLTSLWSPPPQYPGSASTPLGQLSLLQLFNFIKIWWILLSVLVSSPFFFFSSRMFTPFERFIYWDFNVVKGGRGSKRLMRSICHLSEIF